jgi:hypothetical protein
MKTLKECLATVRAIDNRLHHVLDTSNVGSQPGFQNDSARISTD